MIYDENKSLGGVGTSQISQNDRRTNVNVVENNRDLQEKATKKAETGPKQHWDVFLYARVSTKDKDQNPENQLYPLRQWAFRQGYTFREFVDFESGRTIEKRNEFKRMLKLLNLTDGVAVVNIDRWSRNAEMEGVAEALKIKKAGKFLYEGDTNKKLLPTDSEYDWLSSIGFKSVSAALESAAISNRVKRAYNYRKSEADAKHVKLAWGRKTGTYRVMKTDAEGKPILNSNGSIAYEYKEIPAEKVYELYSQGFNLNRIAKEIGCSRTAIRGVLKGYYAKDNTAP
jgi:DNA invertase Pin-like site-specific DNA recombinase